jgi:hypothetical protein
MNSEQNTTDAIKDEYFNILNDIDKDKTILFDQLQQHILHLKKAHTIYKEIVSEYNQQRLNH